ncbi:MerR family transcriptional regulator [Pseudoduganella umbonata]|uniref:DNA-binding transcriptional MerR regulator n=1 Tax=Pseudoduganella umbonata TaxID=864828 RepID=A0A4P8HS80_9BURK|nr:MerR family transcriptional regulator [Pseudoduganella umbonata]MBB3225034.1 DNA-binding transcriptional MerR regulator [Pseudoduganella umbonata]QCP11488.1 MerR family transcriptional regulator [Pseudoduganella umbonata]
MLKIGQLAKHAGLTVRALHHYDDIGLLRPSVRTDAGYRLYHRDDVARLQQIQALRQLGMPLADIGHFLAHSGTSPLAIVERQLAALQKQIDEAARMHAHLTALHARLARGERPELAEWLSTLEQMKMYEQYFSKEELANLRMVHDDECRAEWAALVAEVGNIMAAKTLPTSLEAKQLGLRWMTMLDRDTGGDASLIARLDSMHVNDPAIQESTGISSAMRDYIAEIMGEIKLDTWAKYLLPSEVERMRRHQRSRGKEWHPLFESIRAQFQADPEGIMPESTAVARQKHALFRDMVGDNPETINRFRAALENEPVLHVARGMTNEMIAWLHKVESCQKVA